MPTLMFVRRPGLGDRPLRHEGQQVLGGDVTSSRLRSIWFGPGMTASNASMAIGTRPGWATQVPSWPSVASRSLSARTLASASSLAAGSFLIGICAAMPPMAWAPRGGRS